MNIIQDDRFCKELKDILGFIAKDKIGAAKKLNRAIQEKINSLSNSPRKYKKLQPLNDESIRILIVSGYSIPYFIDKPNQNIVILGIFNANLWEL